MTTQGKARAGTSGPREDVQIFDYIPRDGEDGQFKLFNYRHLASEIASETPRTLLDVGEFRYCFDKLPRSHDQELPRGRRLLKLSGAFLYEK
jgi:hypothetical protein